MKGIIKCCYNCTERHEGCHSECERYIGEKEKHMAERSGFDVYKDYCNNERRKRLKRYR